MLFKKSFILLTYFSTILMLAACDGTSQRIEEYDGGMPTEHGPMGKST